MKNEKHETDRQTLTRKIAIIALVAAAGWCLSAGFYGWMAKDFLKFWVDDAGISFTFSRNIAEGYGSVAAPGGERVEGFSNPTWVYLLALLYRFGGDPFQWSQILAYAFALLTMALICVFAAIPMTDGRRPWPVALGASLVALNASYVIWNQSGMENSLYGFLIMLSLFLVIQEGRKPKAKPWSVAPLLLLALTRPEGVAHFFIAGLFLLLSDLFTQKKPSKRLAAWGGLFVGIFGLYHLWHYIYFAKPFPNTYYAKVEPGGWEKITSLRDRGWRYVEAYFQQYSLLPLLFLCLPAFFAKRVWREALYIALTGLFLVFFPIYSRGDWMEAWRFLSVFPIILTLLLGLAAFNLAGWWQRLAANKLPATAVLVVGIMLSVCWVGVPTAKVAPNSFAFVEKFARKKETTVKMIARRAKWWSKIAGKLALDPYDTTMTDMDMGGTTYNWPGLMFDIGYLLDVPMATHRYTKNWPRMMDEYYFKEKRPEFIHVRRSWGKRTTIPTNPKFKRQYLTLPEDRKFGRIPNGNYVRRDLLATTHFVGKRENRVEVEPFTVGLRLVAVEIPKAVRPGAKTPLFFTWAGDASDLPQCRFMLGTATGEETPRMTQYEPAMGWLPTNKWKKGSYVREVVYWRAPQREGTYHLFIGVKCPSEPEEETRILPLTVQVGDEEAKREALGLLEQAYEMAGRDVLGADLAIHSVRVAEYIMGGKAVRKTVSKIARQRMKTYLKIAGQAFERGEYIAAAETLHRCWRIAPRDDELNDLGWRVAKKLYEIGREYQAAENYEDAYQTFSAACKAQPQHAWARRRAEEVRAERY